MNTICNWFTVIGTPLSIILGIWSICIAGKAKKASEAAEQAAKEAKNATLKRIEEKTKESLFGSFVEQLNNLSTSFQDWENLLNNCNCGKAVNRAEIIAITSNLINEMNKKNEFQQDKTMIKNIEELKKFKDELLVHTDKDNDFEEKKVENCERTLLLIIDDTKKSINAMQRNISKQKEGLGL